MGALCSTTNDIPTGNSNTPQHGFIVAKSKLDPIARIILIALYDDDHIFSVLRGQRYLVKHIWQYAISFNQHYWHKHIQSAIYGRNLFMDEISLYGIQFPPPKNININMMPFIMNLDFKKSKLPSYTQPYFPFIQKCLKSDTSQMNKIGFLTIHESLVKAGRSQRRPGLHIESPGTMQIGGGEITEYIPIGTGSCAIFGGGQIEKYIHDGIYMACNVNDSCAIWHCKIDSGDDGRDVTGHLGDVEHLRSTLDNMTNKTMVRNNKMYWITDRTPHEALPVKEDTYRQFFRLVTSNVSVWYKKHNTPNPNEVKPDPTITRIITKSKF